MAAKLSLADVLALPKSSVKIPRLGFGVYQSPSATCIKSCLTALKAGYRHIDSAQLVFYLPKMALSNHVYRYYENEKEVGTAVSQSGLPRSSVFITTKIMSAAGSVTKSYASLLDSVEKIDGKDGYVDLFLIHTPNGGAAARKEMWLALEKLLDDGKTKSIGVSNFGIGHMEEMKGYAKVWPPMVNQIEVCTSTLRHVLPLELR